MRVVLAHRKRAYLSSIHMNFGRKFWHLCDIRRVAEVSLCVVPDDANRLQGALTLASTPAKFSKCLVVLFDITQLFSEATIEGIQVKLASLKLLSIAECMVAQRLRRRSARVTRLDLDQFPTHLECSVVTLSCDSHIQVLKG